MSNGNKKLSNVYQWLPEYLTFLESNGVKPLYSLDEYKHVLGHVLKLVEQRGDVTALSIFDGYSDIEKQKLVAIIKTGETNMIKIVEKAIEGTTIVDAFIYHLYLRLINTDRIADTALVNVGAFKPITHRIEDFKKIQWTPNALLTPHERYMFESYIYNKVYGGDFMVSRDKMLDFINRFGLAILPTRIFVGSDEYRVQHIDSGAVEMNTQYGIVTISYRQDGSTFELKTRLIYDPTGDKYAEHVEYNSIKLSQLLNETELLNAISDCVSEIINIARDKSEIVPFSQDYFYWADNVVSSLDTIEVFGVSTKVVDGFVNLQIGVDSSNIFEVQIVNRITSENKIYFVYNGKEKAIELPADMMGETEMFEKWIAQQIELLYSENRFVKGSQQKRQQLVENPDYIPTEKQLVANKRWGWRIVPDGEHVETELRKVASKYKVSYLMSFKLSTPTNADNFYMVVMQGKSAKKNGYFVLVAEVDGKFFEVYNKVGETSTDNYLESYIFEPMLNVAQRLERYEILAKDDTTNVIDKSEVISMMPDVVNDSNDSWKDVNTNDLPFYLEDAVEFVTKKYPELSVERCFKYVGISPANVTNVQWHVILYKNKKSSNQFISVLYAFTGSAYVMLGQKSLANTATKPIFIWAYDLLMSKDDSFYMSEKDKKEALLIAKKSFSRAEALKAGFTNDELNNAINYRGASSQNLPAEVYQDFNIEERFKVTKSTKGEYVLEKQDLVIPYKGFEVGVYINDYKGEWHTYIYLPELLGSDYNQNSLNKVPAEYERAYNKMFKYNKKKLQDRLEQEVRYAQKVVEIVKGDKDNKSNSIERLLADGFVNYSKNYPNNFVKEKGNIKVEVEITSGGTLYPKISLKSNNLDDVIATLDELDRKNL